MLFCFLLTTEKSKLKASLFVNRSQDGFLSSITSITVCMYVNINIHTASMLQTQQCPLHVKCGDADNSA